MAVKLEVCVDNPQSLLHAIKGGVDRIELCGPLNVGGTTPSMGFIRWACENTTVPLRIMIRNRGGDFYYDEDDMQTMVADVEVLPEHPMIEGIVFGALTKDNKIDADAMQRIRDCAKNLAFTCHRAFDVAPDYEYSFDVLNAVGVDTVLTSGQVDDATQATTTLCKMGMVNKNVQIMTCAGFKPTVDDTQFLLDECPAPWFHMAAAEPYMWGKTGVPMGDGDTGDMILLTKEHLVRRVVDVLKTQR